MYRNSKERGILPKGRFHEKKIAVLLDFVQITFIAFLDIFSTQNVTKKHNKFRTPGPPPPYLGLSPKIYDFFLLHPLLQCSGNDMFVSNSRPLLRMDGCLFLPQAIGIPSQ